MKKQRYYEIQADSYSHHFQDRHETLLGARRRMKEILPSDYPVLRLTRVDMTRQEIATRGMINQKRGGKATG